MHGVDTRPAVGRLGEEVAARLFEERGFAVVERNYRCRAGEIDLVLRKGRLVVFCEVKARTSAYWGEPSEAVGALKQQRLRRLAAMWLAARRPGRVEIRFDVVSVVLSATGPDVTHIANAF